MKLAPFYKKALSAILAILVFLALQIGTFILHSKFTCEELLRSQDLVFADSYIGLLRDGKFSEVSARLNPALQQKMAGAQAQMKQLLERTSALPRQFVGCYSTFRPESGEAGREVEVTVQWASETTALLGNLAWKGSENPQVQGVNVKVLPERLETIHAFRLFSKGAKHWAFFLASLLIPAFIFYTMVSCWRESGLRRWWLWIIFISLGFWPYSFNWTTGEITGLFLHGNLNVLSLLILGGSIARSNEFTPFLVSVSLPLGALLYWACKYRSGPKKAE
jgi:hypothetical protein